MLILSKAVPINPLFIYFFLHGNVLRARKCIQYVSNYKVIPDDMNRLYAVRYKSISFMNFSILIPAIYLTALYIQRNEKNQRSCM